MLVAFTLQFGLLFLIFGPSRGGAGAVLSLFLVPLVTFLCLLLARVLTEGLALFFRIGENTSVIAGALSAGVTPTVGPTTYAGSTVVTPNPAPPLPAAETPALRCVTPDCAMFNRPADGPFCGVCGQSTQPVQG